MCWSNAALQEVGLCAFIMMFRKRQVTKEDRSVRGSSYSEIMVQNIRGHDQMEFNPNHGAGFG